MLKFLLFAFFVLLPGCRHSHSRNGLKRAEKVSECAEVITKEMKTKDMTTGELLHIREEAVDEDARKEAKGVLLKAYPAKQTLASRQLATTETVAHYEKQLKQSNNNIMTEVAKISEQATEIKQDFTKTLEKELKLSTIQTIATSICGALAVLLLFNLIIRIIGR